MKIGNEDLQVNRPHYISRYDRPTPKNTHCCSKECLGTKLRVGPQKAGFQRSAQQKKQKSRQFRQKVARIRQQLLAMLAQNKVQLQIDVIMKRLAATRQKQSHGRVLAEVRAQLQTLKREVYLLYKHTCSNRKDRLCLNCQQRQHYFRTRVLSFLQQRKRDSSISNHPNQEPNTSSRSHSSDASQKRSPQGREPKALVDSSNYQSLKWSRPSKRETKSARFSGFRINREAEKLKTTRKKIGESPAVQQNQTNNAYAKDRKNSRKYSAFRSLQNNAESSKALNQKIPPESEDCGSELSQCNELRESHNPKRIMRKSVKLESEGKTAEPQGSPKSKFYNMSKEQKGRKTTEMRPSMGCDPKSLEKNGQGGQEFRVKEKKQRVAICQGTKNLKQSQLTLDLPELQSNKQIAYQKVHREREEIEPLVCERQHLNNPNLAKLSRYQRQRLIYGQLKKELIKLSCFDEDNLVTSQADRDQGSQANICSLQGENSYSIQDRKQSLLCKLNIFNQSVSFDDLKTKIETAIGQQQVTGERALEGRGRREQKIVEKFLAEVLKITDLKRLLRKKFSKELDWSPRMREMHQFYTYLEFNLENFRVNLAKNTHSNWQQLAFQGKQQHSHLHQLHITEDLGHYKGLDIAEITQFDHHKEIQCSMRYYGIEVKRQRQLQQFLQPAPELPSPLPDKIAQKSIKEIKQQDIASVRAT